MNTPAVADTPMPSVPRRAREALRREMEGRPAAAIAAAMAARLDYRPRRAWREACNLSQQQVADAYNDIEDSGCAPMTKQRIAEWERWPSPRCRGFSVYTLGILARVFGTTRRGLLDAADYAAMTQRDRALLDELEPDPVTAGRNAAAWSRLGVSPAPETPTLTVEQMLFPPDGEGGADMDRRTAIRAGSVSVAGVITGGAYELGGRFLMSDQPLPVPTGGGRIDLGAVTVIRDTTIQLNRLDDQVGTGAAIGPAYSVLGTVASLLKHRSYTEDTGKQLWLQAAELFRLIAWCEHDRGNEALSRRYYEEGVKAAILSGDKGFGAYVMTRMSSVVDDPHEARYLMQAAYDGGRRHMTGAQHLKYQINNTSVCAKAGDARGAMASADKSAELSNGLLDGSIPAEEGYDAYLADILPRFSAASVGNTLVGIGRPDAAMPMIEDSITRSSAIGAHRDTARGLLYLANAHLAAGKPEAAASYGTQAADVLDGLQAPGQVRLMTQLATALPASTDPAITAFKHRARKA